MKKILLSLFSIGVVAVVAVFATQAFFTDTEKSTGNLFQAGALDLKVDNECHYWTWEGVLDLSGQPVFVDKGCLWDDNNTSEAEWTLSDLIPGVHKFFNFDDIKPGDFGEDTVSLHVFDNDAWGRLVIDVTEDSDNTCTEPELDPVDEDCLDTNGVGGDGELREKLIFWAWLDQGSIPGFQNIDPEGNPINLNEEPGFQAPDPLEGDNVWNGQQTEPILIEEGTVNDLGSAQDEIHNIWEGLSLAYVLSNCADPGPTPPDFCKGLTADGRMVGSTTYYFGLAWELPSDVGNEVQSDRFVADMTFEVEQYRNNPTPFAP